MDYLATVDTYPRPDDKIRSGELQISGGGNARNGLTGAARLGLNTRLISKVANDEIGSTVLSDLKEAGIDVSHVIVRLGLQIYSLCIVGHHVQGSIYLLLPQGKIATSPFSTIGTRASKISDGGNTTLVYVIIDKQTQK